MGGLGGVHQPSGRLDPAGQLLAEDGCALLPAPAGPSPSTWTGGQWEEQVEKKGSAGLINHLFPLLCLFSLPFAPSCGAVPISSVFASDAGVMLGTAETGVLRLSHLDHAAVTAMEVWDGVGPSCPCHGLTLPRCCLSPPAKCWARSAQGE